MGFLTSQNPLVVHYGPWRTGKAGTIPSFPLTLDGSLRLGGHSERSCPPSAAASLLCSDPVSPQLTRLPGDTNFWTCLSNLNVTFELQEAVGPTFPQGLGNRCPCCNLKGVNPVVLMTQYLMDIRTKERASFQSSCFFHRLCQFVF